MSIHTRSLRKRPVVGLFVLLALSLFLTQCKGSTPPSLGAEHCGGIACTGVTQCQTNAPLCAIASSATCLPDAPRECAWKLNISASCPCLEHDVRLCTVGASTPGVQICTANAGRTATYWASCVACPNCTP